VALEQNPVTTEAKPRRPEAEDANTVSSWYGWQTLTADGAGVLLLAVGAAKNVPQLGYMGVTTYLVGAPIVHIAHAHVGRGFGSLGLRIGAPIAGFATGFVVVSRSEGHAMSWGGLFGGMLGMLVGMSAAVVIDGAALSYERRLAPKTAPTQGAFSATPVAFAVRGGGVGGIAGTF
jgi:hypothetical protein